MRLNRLTENIYYTECDSNSDRPVLGYINGDRCSVMVDAGNSTNHVKDYNFFLTQQGLKKPKYCNLSGVIEGQIKDGLERAILTLHELSQLPIS